MAKIDRKEYMIFMNVTPASTATYVKIGKGAEEITTALNYELNQTSDVTGLTDTTVTLGNPETPVDTFYADDADALTTFLQDAVDNNKENDDLKTDIIMVKGWDDSATPPDYPAIKEIVHLVPQSTGGDTTGYQIPFNIAHSKDKTSGTFNMTTLTFTAV